MEQAGQSAVYLMQFMTLLPDDVYPAMVDTVCIDDDGWIILDWYADRHHAVTIFVTHTGSFGYAWMINGERGHGVIREMPDVLPDVLLSKLREVSHAQAIADAHC